MVEPPWLAGYPPAIDWHAAIPVQPLPALFAQSARRFGPRPCLDFLGRRYSYADVERLIERAARGFQNLGVTKGARVGLFLPNCPQFVVAYFAILRAGGTVVTFSPLYAEAELRHQVLDSGTEFMVTLNLTALYPRAQALIGGTQLRRLVVGTLSEVLPFPKNFLHPIFHRREIAEIDGDAVRFSDLIADATPPAPVAINPDTDIALLQYTGGTTGTPKGAMLTHANLSANAHQALLWLDGVRWGEEKMLAVLPFFHVFAMTVAMNLALYVGAEIIIHPRFRLEDVLRDIHRKRPTLLPGVPTMYAAINSADLRKFDLTSIRFCISGGAPLPVEVKQRFETLTGCKLVEGYGLTETAPVATCNPLYGVNKAGSIGLPLPGTTVTITDRNDPSRVLGAGERGEICISGPQVMRGYWNRADETGAAIVDGRLRTGDIGYLDAQGYVFLVDRIKDLILVGGFNVYPRVVEEAIYQHDAVVETIVIGIPDDYRGQAVKAFVRVRDGARLTQAELLAFLESRVGRHEMPHEVEFRAALPRTLVGKLSKKELVEEELAKARVKSGANVPATDAGADLARGSPVADPAR